MLCIHFRHHKFVRLQFCARVLTHLFFLYRYDIAGKRGICAGIYTYFPALHRHCQSNVLQIIMHDWSHPDSNFLWSYFHQFWKDPQRHWLKRSTKPWQCLHHVLHLALGTQLFLSPPFSVHTDNNLIQKFQISVRLVASDFQCSFCVIWLNSVFSTVSLP